MRSLAKRYSSIDIMRTLAIAYMVIYHYVELLADPNKITITGNIGVAVWSWTYHIGGFAAPFFLFLVGVSFYISTFRRVQKGFSNRVIFIRNLKRGIIIMTIGYLVNLYIWGLEYFYSSDILPFIGFSLIILSFIDYYVKKRRLKDFYIIFAGLIMVVVILFTAELLRLFFGYPEIMSDGYSLPAPKTFLSGLTAILFKGYFSIFPWFIFVISGYITGKIITDFKIQANKGIFYFYITFFSIQLPIGWVLLSSGADNTFFPATLTCCIIRLGTSIITFFILYYIFDIKLNNSFRTIKNFCERISIFSLSIYIIHFALLSWSIMWIKKVCFRDYYNSLNFEFALLISLLFLSCVSIFTYYWKKKDSILSLEWGVSKLI